MALNIIVMNRGDTYQFNLTINDMSADDGLYQLKGEDTVYLGIMDPNQSFEHALVKKVFTKENQDEGKNILVSIEPEDTLDLFPGKYYYAVKLRMDHDEIDGLGETQHIEKVDTIINKTKFIICD